MSRNSVALTPEALSSVFSSEQVKKETLSGQGKKFNDVTALPHAEQAKVYLNVFWDKGAKDNAAEIKTLYKEFITNDKKNGEKGTSLDEFNALQFLSNTCKTPMTSSEFRKHFKAIDADNDGKLAFVEFLLDKYKHSVKELMEGYQGEINQEFFAHLIRLDELKAIAKKREDDIAELERKAAANEGGGATKLKLTEAKNTPLPESVKQELIKLESAFKKLNDGGAKPLKAQPGTVFWSA